MESPVLILENVNQTYMKEKKSSFKRFWHFLKDLITAVSGGM